MFSVVLPVFNAEKTILKTIESILNNKKENIEIIIVNDGSTDNTQKILKNYEEDNRFKIITQSNAGVSIARNKALESLNAKSQYVAFIDDSDSLSKNYIEEHIKTLNEYPEINLSIAPIILEKNGRQIPQSLNYRFDISEDIVDINKHPEFVQYHLGGTVFRTEIFTKDKLRFVERMSFWEDALLINSVILKDKKYGLVKKANYYYDRNNENSLSHTAWSDESRYTKHIKNSYFPLIKLSERLYGKTVDYVQFLIARHYLQYLMEHNQESIIKYKNFIDKDFEIWSRNLFRYIDKKTIDDLACPINCKMYMYYLKEIPMELDQERKLIKVLIQKIDFKTREITFTFSKEATGIDGDSKVFINNEVDKQAQIIESKKYYFLGLEQSGDITFNKYKMPLNIKNTFNKMEVCIQIDDKKQYEIISPSIIRRVMINIKNRFFRKWKGAQR